MTVVMTISLEAIPIFQHQSRYVCIHDNTFSGYNLIWMLFMFFTA